MSSEYPFALFETFYNSPLPLHSEYLTESRLRLSDGRIGEFSNGNKEQRRIGRVSKRVETDSRTREETRRKYEGFSSMVDLSRNIADLERSSLHFYDDEMLYCSSIWQTEFAIAFASINIESRREAEGARCVERFSTFVYLLLHLVVMKN